MLLRLPPAPLALTLLIALAASANCSDDASAPSDTSAGASTGATGAATAASSDGSGPVDPPARAQGDSCTCNADPPYSCGAAASNCDVPLSCVLGGCRQACASVDDTSCPAETQCVGLQVDAVDLGFWCS